MFTAGRSDSAHASRLFFVSRSYPPVRGGLELHNRRLLESLGAHYQTRAIVNPRGKPMLPWFLARALWVLLVRTRPGDKVLFGDLLTASLAPVLRMLGRKPELFSCAHGTDVVWSPTWYQRWITRRVLPNLTAAIAVSDATREALLARGLPPERAFTVGNGTDPVPLLEREDARSRVARSHGIDLQGRHVLLSLGRLVPRKSVAWFVDQVMPALPPDCLLIIAGDGPERSRIRSLVRQHGLEQTVCLLGAVTDEDRTALYNGADVFIMPNRPMPGDMEGFGISRLEASSVGLPIVASDLEGLRQTVADEGNTRLVRPGDRDGFVAAILELREHDRPRDAREAIRNRITEKYSWATVADHYARHMSDFDENAAGQRDVPDDPQASHDARE